ncbi:MAG: glycosyltransferase, partial [Acidobacteriia bacterium]|nr:glycosyltransferase [Terriglobia bacterium]
TNVKVLEAMAMQRAVVSTTAGCAGLGLVHGESVWIADEPDAFAEAITTLLSDPTRRAALAEAAYEHARRHFDWRSIGARHRALLAELLR